MSVAVVAVDALILENVLLALAAAVCPATIAAEKVVTVPVGT